MPDSVIFNRATGGHSPKPGGDGPWATIEKLLDGIFSRLHALEMRTPARNGRDGKDADPELIRKMVAEEVAAAMSDLEPKPRKKVTTVTRHDDQGRILEFTQEDA